jgi:hypothetical protein
MKEDTGALSSLFIFFQNPGGLTLQPPSLTN